MTALFVTATGTGIGKTLVTCLLARQLRAAGRRVRALKPVATGYTAARDSDSAQLLAALGEPITDANVAAISPWRFAAPLSPDMAAEREGRALDVGETRLVLGEESINFEGTLNVPLPNVSHVTCTGTGASPSEVRLTLQAERPSVAEKELVFDVEIPDVVSLLEFLRLKRPSALR